MEKTSRDCTAGVALSALSYYDLETGQVVIVALVQDSPVQAVPRGVVYSNAFRGLQADIRFRVHRWGLEQDVILRGGLPRPADLDMDPAHARLCVISELGSMEGSNLGIERPRNLSPAHPDPAPLQLFAEVDGAWQRLFNWQRCYSFPAQAAERPLQHRDSRIPVSLRVFEQQSRLFLSEEIPLSDLMARRPQLFNGRINPQGLARYSLQTLPLPERPPRPDAYGLQAADSPDTPADSLAWIIDYIDYSGSVTNDLTFQQDQTYYISDDLVLDGCRLDIDPGAVIKLQTGAVIRLQNGARVSSTAHAADPAIFTSCHDSPGEGIPGCTNNPADNLYQTALILESGTNTLRGLDIRYAQVGIEAAAPGVLTDLRDLRIFSSTRGLELSAGDTNTLSACNVLVSNCQNGFYLSTNRLDLTCATLVDIDQGFTSVTTGVGHLQVSGALFSSVSNICSTAQFASCSFDHNAAWQSTNGWAGSDVITLTNAPLASGPYGGCYLDQSSGLVDQGATNAAVLGLYHFTTDPSETKETNSIVDIGFHYPVVADQDSDDLDDHIEDANGNGTADPGETDWQDADSDDDGIGDGAETGRGTDPLDPDSASTNLYADSSLGLDTYDGLSAIVTNGHGPKATIGAAIGAAYSGDDIYAASNTYQETTWTLSGKDLTLKLTGSIQVQ